MELKNKVWMTGSLEWYTYIGEDEVFLGSRCVVVEGVRVGRGAVLGAAVAVDTSAIMAEFWTEWDVGPRFAVRRVS